MRFYGIQPSELERLEPHQRLGLYLNIEHLRAKEYFEQVQLMNAANASNKEDRREYLISLAELAFAHDDIRRAQALESISRS